MKGYPKNIATKTDFLFLLSDPEYTDQALVDLKKFLDFTDDSFKKIISYELTASGHMINVVLMDFPNPFPQWNRFGFKNKKEISDILEAFFVESNPSK